MLFGSVDKEAFCKIMRRLERFSGVEILTYAVMGNHFHLLVRVPDRELDSWEERAAKTLTTGAEWYRTWLFGEGREQRDEAGHLKRRGLDRKTVRKVIEGGGKLSRAQLLRCRVRYFSAGVAIGSKSFVEGVFKARHDHFGPKRKDGARAIRVSDTGLFSLRNLRVQAVE